jgi:chromate transporter
VQSGRRSPLEILAVFLKLGLTSFGGPVAHLGFFHDELVRRRRWLNEAAYADLVALCQFLPGPASSQIGFATGLLKAGWLGGAAAWLGFTLPSAVLMIAFGYGLAALGPIQDAGWLHGLKIAAVAVVAQAVWLMAIRLCPDRARVTLALLAAAFLLVASSAVNQVVVILCGALSGWVLFREKLQLSGVVDAGDGLVPPIKRRTGVICLALFGALLVSLPLLATATHSRAIDLFSSFYRSGALVFGGGHVILPLLQAEVVDAGWVSNNAFLAGYGAAQALPGPLFTFAAYLGTQMHQLPNGLAGGLLCLTAIFLPSVLLVAGALPFWHTLRSRAPVQAALAGANAAVVGLLLAALYDPVWTSAITGPRDVAVGFAAFGMLQFWKLPPWLVVLLAALEGALWL